MQIRESRVTKFDVPGHEGRIFEVRGLCDPEGTWSLQPMVDGEEFGDPATINERTLPANAARDVHPRSLDHMFGEVMRMVRDGEIPIPPPER